MVSVEHLSVEFSARPLFTDVSFVVNDRDRIALTGKNGAGKSTLLKIIAGQQAPTSGVVAVPRDTTIGYLPQVMNLINERTVMEEALLAFDHIRDLQADIERMSAEMMERTDYESDDYLALVERYTHAEEHFRMMGGLNFHAEVERTLLGLGFERTDFNRPTGELSGGWRMRIELAKLLLRQPDVLLLDEPTNHLDIESIQWLEQYLIQRTGAVVLVSHDRTFLDNITKRTIEITAGRIYDYKVPYSEYVVQMQERRASQMASLTNQQRQVAQIEAFIERFRYKATKSKQVQSRIKMLEKMDKISVDEVSTESIRFQFPPAPHSGKIVLEASHLGKAYGDNQVFDNVDFLVTKGAKLAFVGRNGEGKSTLAKIIVGELTDYTGSFRVGQGVQIGYYAQNQAAMLDGEKTVFQTIDDAAFGDIRPKIRNILGSFLFDDDDIDKKVKVLSGGEKARLALAKLLLTPSNLLVLDEPTNHLDMDSKDVLKNALLQYQGTLVVVSHDRDFLQGLTDSLFEFRDGGVHEFKGDIFEFLEFRKMEHLKELDKVQKQNAADRQSQPVSQNKLNYQQSKERERELRKLRSNVEKIEKEIAELEQKIADKETLLSGGEAAADADFYKEYQSLKEQLEERMTAWEEASIELELMS